MNSTRRLSLTLLVLGILFLLGILFRSFILDYLVSPVALLLWIFWRILQSVHQAVYWSGLAFLAIFYVFFYVLRPIFRSYGAPEQTSPPSPNVILENIRYWRMMILITRDETDEFNIQRRNLGKMLTEMYVTQQPGTNYLEIFNALKLGQIPLPENIHAFLFPPEPDPRRTIQKVLQTIWQTPGKLFRRWTGREVKKYYQTIEEVIAFMETSMEIKQDNGTIHTSNYSTGR